MLEVCVDNLESAMAAAQGGAIRIELCSALSEGGLTPTPGLLKAVKKYMRPRIPVYVMIRLHRASDFVYSESEQEIMLDDVTVLKQFGADGFVYGALTTSHDVDVSKCTQVTRACAPLPCTFHRAFDICQDPFGALEVIIRAGYERILTSGMAVTADCGVQLIRDLIRRAQGRIKIMPGSGINKKNAFEILHLTGAKEFHASARVQKLLSVPSDHSITMGKTNPEPFFVTDKRVVQELVTIGSQIKAERMEQRKT